MNGRHINKQSTRAASNVRPREQRVLLAANRWNTLREIALAGWASTTRLAVLLLVKQGPAGVLIFLIMRK
jgi:hypothetical protein